MTRPFAYLISMCLLAALAATVTGDRLTNVDWESVHFEPMNPLTAHVIDGIVPFVGDSMQAEYSDSLAVGNNWWCISYVLNTLVYVVFEYDPTVLDSKNVKTFEDSIMFDAFTRHSGQSWVFWRDVVARRQTAAATDSLPYLHPEIRRVLLEIEREFEPLLDPYQSQWYMQGINR